MNMEISLGLFKANECLQICNRRRRTAEFKAAVSFVVNIRTAATPTNISCLFILLLTAYLGPRILTFGAFFFHSNLITFSLSDCSVSPIATFKRSPEELIRWNLPRLHLLILYHSGFVLNVWKMLNFVLLGFQGLEYAWIWMSFSKKSPDLEHNLVFNPYGRSWNETILSSHLFVVSWR